MKFGVVFILFFLIFNFPACATGTGTSAHIQENFKIIIVQKNVGPDSIILSDSTNYFFQTKKENKKLIAAILAFPPFGLLGLHRIYLGSEPWIPVVYLFTLGGCGILCVGDFIAIIRADDKTLKSYENNSKIFMWVN